MAERQPKRDIRTKALACMYIASRSTVHALLINDREGVESNRGYGRVWPRSQAVFLRRRGKTAGPQARGRGVGQLNSLAHTHNL